MEGYDRIQEYKNKVKEGAGDPSVLESLDGKDPSNMDLGSLLDQGELGIEMIKNADEAIKALNNDKINSAVDKVKDNKFVKKL